MTAESSGPRPLSDVSTSASLADLTVIVDQGDDVVLRLWLPGGIAVEDGRLPWNVYLHAELDGHHHVVVTYLEIKKRSDGPGITAAGLREVLVGELIDELLSRRPVATLVRRVEGEADVDKWPPATGEIPPALLAEAKRRTQAQRGRRAQDEQTMATLEKVAAIARSAKPGQVLRDLAAAGFGKPSVAKKKLRAARDAGLLEHSSRSAKANGRKQ